MDSFIKDLPVTHAEEDYVVDIQVNHYRKQDPDPHADNPDDYHGYTESEWDIVAVRGDPERPLPCSALEFHVMLTPREVDDIDQRVQEIMEERIKAAKIEAKEEREYQDELFRKGGLDDE